jgi:hypothetical protein
MPHIRISPLAACDQAAGFLRKAGFALVWVSMKSEATYFQWPGRHGVLRVATHRKGSRNTWSKDGPTLVSCTFPEGNAGKDGLITMSDIYIEHVVANAIGLYLLRSSPKASQ